MQIRFFRFVIKKAALNFTTKRPHSNHLIIIALMLLQGPSTPEAQEFQAFFFQRTER